MILLHLTLVIIQLIICYGLNDYIVRDIDNNPRRCLPIYNCEPGHEILPCTEEFTEEKCSPCYDDPKTPYKKDYVQPDYISSVDDISKLRCFRPLIINGEAAECTGQDLLYDNVDLGNQIKCLAGRGCKCNLNKCHFGDPCFCDYYIHTKSEGCGTGYHLNNSGVCVPCPYGFVKNESGCGPCKRVPSNTTVTTTTTKKPVPNLPSTQAQTTTTPKPKPTTQKTTTSTTPKVIVTPKPRNEKDDNSTTPIIIGIGFSVVFLIIIIMIIILYRKGKCKFLKNMLDKDRRNVPEERNNAADEEQPLQLEHMQNEINDIHIIEAGNKPNNNNMTRTESECPSERFDSASTVSVNRQLSNISAADRINSNTSESSPLLKVEDKVGFDNPHIMNRMNSVPNPSILHREEFLPNPQELNRAVSVPQQASENGNTDFTRCTTMPSSNNSSSQLVPSPTSGRQPFLDTMGGGIPPLDFDNIQSSNPVMNTELPNIGEFKRSLSKDSSSSMDFSSSSPLNSVPEETGKEIQDEVAEEFRSGVVPECDISNYNNDYADCHLSQFPDTPRDSDITNQIDSRLEEYNHIVAGTDDGATCSVQRLPSEHEEETMKKKDLESNLDSGMMSNCSKGSDLSKSDSV